MTGLTTTTSHVSGRIFGDLSKEAQDWIAVIEANIDRLTLRERVTFARAKCSIQVDVSVTVSLPRVLTDEQAKLKRRVRRPPRYAEIDEALQALEPFVAPVESFTLSAPLATFYLLAEIVTLRAKAAP